MATVPVPHQFAVGEIATADNINTYYSGISFLENPPIALIYQNSGQAIPTGTADTTLTFDSTLIDTYNGHSNSVNNSRYTAQVAGWYRANAYCSFGINSTGYRSVGIKKNGSFIQSSVMQGLPGSASWGTFATPTTYVFMNVGDFLEVVVSQTSGGSLTNVVGAPVGPSLTIAWVHV